jgi:phosphoglycolate phosphatase-like HAD superfamily hydrolase
VPDVEVEQAVARINVERYEEFKVNPEKIWPSFIERVKVEFSLDDVFVNWAKERADKIYTTLPELVPGAIEVLDTLKAAGIRMAIVTHATEGWTRFKMEGNDISKYFEYVHAVSVDEFKTAPDWQKALVKMKADPERTAVIGDNLRGDVLSAATVGVEVLFWVRRPNAWSVYSKGELPPKTHVVTNLTEMLPIVFGAKEKAKSKKLKEMSIEK